MQTSKDQATGVIERLAYGAILALMMKLVQKGYIDADMAAYIAGGVVAAAGSIYAWWINRPKAILKAAAAVPNPASPTGLTQVITSPQLAQATPDQPNIVSSTQVQVVSK